MIKPILEDMKDHISASDRSKTYGRTLGRAQTVWVPIEASPKTDGNGRHVLVLTSRPHVRTPEKQEGTIHSCPATEKLTHAVMLRWVDEYMKEVDACCKMYLIEHGDAHEDLANELDRLIHSVEDFRWGKRTQQQLGKDTISPAVEVLLRQGRDRLLVNLRQRLMDALQSAGPNDLLEQFTQVQDAETTKNEFRATGIRNSHPDLEFSEDDWGAIEKAVSSDDLKPFIGRSLFRRDGNKLCFTGSKNDKWRVAMAVEALIMKRDKRPDGRDIAKIMNSGIVEGLSITENGVNTNVATRQNGEGKEVLKRTEFRNAVRGYFGS